MARHRMCSSCFKKKADLTLFGPEAPKWVLIRTVKTQMKCGIKQRASKKEIHFKDIGY